MEGLFNLLAETPLLLLFIIAAIISFVQGRGGKKKEEQQGRPKQQQRPTVSNKQEQEVDWKEIFRQEGKQEQPHSSSSSSQGEFSNQASPLDSNDEFQERYEQMQERKKLSITKADQIGTTAIGSSPVSSSRKAKVRLDFSRITRDEAVKGVVWSEILGKPKALRK